MNTSPLSWKKYKIFRIQEQWTWILKFSLSDCTGFCPKNYNKHHNHNIFMILSPSLSTSSPWYLKKVPFWISGLSTEVIMGACLNPPCNPARVSSQLANEVLGPAFQKVIIFGIPWIMMILFRSPESLLFLYFLSCEAAFFLLVARSRYRLREHNDNDDGIYI